MHSSVTWCVFRGGIHNRCESGVHPLTLVAVAARFARSQAYGVHVNCYVERPDGSIDLVRCPSPPFSSETQGPSLSCRAFALLRAAVICTAPWID